MAWASLKHACAESWLTPETLLPSHCLTMRSSWGFVALASALICLAFCGGRDTITDSSSEVDVSVGKAQASRKRMQVGERFAMKQDAQRLQWNIIRSKLQKKCQCSQKRNDRLSCLKHFLEPESFDKLKRERIYFANLHKLDQDELLFDKIHDLALSQGLVAPEGLEASRPNAKLAWYFQGKRVCIDAWSILHGAGRNPRVSNIFRAVLDGKKGPPADLRYLRGSISGATSEKARFFRIWKACGNRLQKRFRKHCTRHPPL